MILRVLYNREDSHANSPKNESLSRIVTVQSELLSASRSELYPGSLVLSDRHLGGSFFLLSAEAGY